MSSIIFDIQELYQRQFGSRPHIVTPVPAQDDAGDRFVLNSNNIDNTSSAKGYKLREKYLGVEIWLPIRLIDVPVDKKGNMGQFYLPYSAVRVTGSSTIVRTPLAERRGTVKEQYNVEDYKISVKGFFIDKEQRVWPEDDIYQLKLLHEFGKSFGIDNALISLFLDSDDKVIFTGFDLPEVEGKQGHVRPYSFTLESDSVFTLEVE